MASEIPATSEVLLKTDGSKQILDALLGQGWDVWGTNLGGSGASELMLQLFSAFNLIALAVISALFIWVLAVAVAGTAHVGTPFGKRFSSLWMPLRFVGATGSSPVGSTDLFSTATREASQSAAWMKTTRCAVAKSMP